MKINRHVNYATKNTELLFVTHVMLYFFEQQVGSLLLLVLDGLQCFQERVDALRLVYQNPEALALARDVPTQSAGGLT